MDTTPTLAKRCQSAVKQNEPIKPTNFTGCAFVPLFQSPKIDMRGCKSTVGGQQKMVL